MIDNILIFNLLFICLGLIITGEFLGNEMKYFVPPDVVTFYRACKYLSRSNVIKGKLSTKYG